MTRRCFTAVFAFFLSIGLHAQKRLSLQDCEAQFQKSNLLLLSEQYNIDIATARVVQAKIWDQPVVVGELNAIDPQNGKVFNVGQEGQKALAVQQLIYLGGKKKNEVAFAKSNLPIATLQFEQLLQALRYQIRQSFYSVYFDELKTKTIVAQLASIDTLSEAYMVQSEKGNVPLKDVVRLQSLALSLKNELTEVQKNIYAEQENLKILTNLADDILPLVGEGTADSICNKPFAADLGELQNKALAQNPEYLTTVKITSSNELFLKWQQSLAAPDLTVGAAYDQRGGAFQNQVNLTVALPLPFWNRNKGNIQVAEKQIAQSKSMQQQKALELTARISTAYNNLVYQQRQYQKISKSTAPNLELVYSGVLQNFQKRNISLIEFTDFMESYNQSSVLLNEMKKQLLIAGENLNYLVNEKIF
ncbi:TolC family protein [Flavihumibacter profundi]|uniref:TolC family protein n=1 Tax=Flavihumibacter profundi TaxID=2716883 RepID=UPI001CC75A9B|nr:TolC family protein [Flavihumibacter profundi]MBZ5856847.1 TolC family protein [Flavihumibacter profundi]